MFKEQATILIVDDNPDLLSILQERIEQRDHKTLTAVNGRQALAILQKETIHLVILDIMMPEMDGFDVLERIKANPTCRHIPVLVMSALHDLDSVVKCIKLGAEDHLPKPINNALLWARINASLVKKRLYDQEQAQMKMAAIWEQIDCELNSTLDLTEASQITLKWAMSQTKSATGIIGAIAESTLELWYAAGLPESNQTDFSLLTLAPVNEFTLNGRPQQWPLDAEKSHFAEAGYRTFVPISRDDTKFALMVLDSNERLEDWCLDFLSRLSNHAAIALNNAHLHEKVQAANIAKSNFVALVSHELKAPLSVFRLYAGLLNRNDTSRLIEKKDDYIRILDLTTQRMINLVAELDDISRIEIGNLQLALTAVSLHEVIDEVLHTFAHQVKEKEQHISVDLVPSLPLIWADRQRLVQILTNLISNACKYTQAGGQITVCTRRKPDDPESFAQIYVQDNGMGIEKADQKKIFTQFFRADSVQTQKISGTGLGLSITRQLVELQNGQIWFESEAGHGTTFYFTMPFATE